VIVGVISISTNVFLPVFWSAAAVFYAYGTTLAYEQQLTPRVGLTFSTGLEKIVADLGQLW